MYAPKGQEPILTTLDFVQTFLARALVSVQNLHSLKNTLFFYRDPERFWTSGQWMTEKKGGSDVSGGTETFATPIEDQEGYYSLVGYKWFSSATDSDIALTLGRTSRCGFT